MSSSTKNQTQRPTKMTPTQGFVFGGISCMTAALVTNPVDVIKTRLQLQGQLAAAHDAPKYNGFLRGMLTIVTEEGPRGLYKGISASLLREGTYSTLRMGLYQPIKDALKTPGETHELLWKKVVAAASSGAIGSAITNPVDLIKIRMQARGDQQVPYKNIIDAFRTIARNEGLGGLYKGVGPNVQRAAVLTASQLPSYDHSKKVLIGSGLVQEGIVAHVICSMFAGLVAATFTSPFDLVKSRYMNQRKASGPSGTPGAILYKSPLDCFVKTVQNEGVRGLFKGWLPNWMRIGPHTIVTFMVMEQLRRLVGVEPI
ncbi:solute carrier family 25, member 30-like protein [Polychytrium aggregatum]|uniref:solute carrier family 25, member 30-like protein n=1 Tax=Polychytrium aggregatum TaxID=110093 RepID=UPI0022FF0A6D|nr:solute carrier family 25, member 30-like protein [Polychytrium aggregatum]KAI9201842.1 solute carrier family 25, member 30-like protein [Polychytrium aggregatum]